MVPKERKRSLTTAQTSLTRHSMGTTNFAGLRRLLDYQVTPVIRHCTSRIMSNYTVNYR